MGKFEGKVAVVTGAGQSVGFETAKMFVEEGATVIMAGRTLSKVENAAKAIGSEKAIPYKMDVGSEEDWKALVSYIKEKFGEFDYLVNNAAVLYQKTIHDMSLEEFRETERCNMESVFLGMKYCYEVLKKGCYSAIVNVSSVGAFKSGPSAGNDPGYNSTKAGIRNMTKHAAYLYAKDCIKVNSVHPGGINTPMRDEYLKKYPERAAASAAIKPIPPHVSEPEEVAAVILFACDPFIKTMTGSELVIDCGNMTM